MSHCRRFLVVLVVAALSQAYARADFAITVVPSIGPNAFDAANGYLPVSSVSGPTGYYTNALNSLAAVYSPGTYGVTPLISGATNTPGTAGYYSSLNPGAKVPTSSITTTGFNSWMAMAPPSANYSAQYGNSLYFGLVVKPTGATTSFTLAQLNSANTTNNAALSGDLIYNGYSPSAKIYVALTPGGPLVSSLTNGITKNTPIYGLVSVGSADSIAGDYYPFNGSLQAQINYNLLQAGIGNFPYNEQYSLTDSNGNTFSGNALVDIQGVPEPATWTLLGVGALGLMVRRRFARAKVAA